MGERLSKFLGITAGAILFIFIVFAWLWLTLVMVVLSDFAFLVVLLLGTFCAAVIIHEVGHVLAALASGFRILVFIIGPVAIFRTRKGIKMRRNRRPQILGGVLAGPTDDLFSVRRMAFYIAGGSLANLLVAALCFWGAYQLNESFTPSYPAGQVTGWITKITPRNQIAASVSVAGLMDLLFVLNLLIPIRIRGQSSDCAQLVDLFWNKPLSDTRWLLTILQGYLLDGIRPRDWNAAFVERLLTARTGTTEEVEANRFGYYYARDTGQIELAGELIDLAIGQSESLSQASLPAVLLEGAYFEGRYRRNLIIARKWLQQAERGFIEQQTRLRAEAAVLWAEGRFAEAAAKAQQGLAVLPSSVDPGGAIAEGDWLNEILEDCQKGMTENTDQKNLGTS